jgi:phosphonate transport system substrate-binding protein
MEAGLNMHPDGSGQGSSQDVRYLFGGAEINVVGSLIRGRVEAAAISNLDMDDDEVMTSRFKNQLRVLHETRRVPRSVMLMRSSLPPSVRDDLKAILLDAHQTDTGRAVLRKYLKIKQFESMAADIHAEFAWVRDAYNTHHKK